jgi:hypothetical protein
LILSTNSGDDGVGNAVTTFEVESHDADTFAENVVVDLIMRAVDGYGDGASHSNGC